jgi:hypothetical protein
MTSEATPTHRTTMDLKERRIVMKQLNGPQYLAHSVGRIVHSPNGCLIVEPGYLRYAPDPDQYPAHDADNTNIRCPSKISA